MIREITYICRNLGSRSPGSAGERKAAGYMADRLKNECGCYDVRLESFKLHPSAFYVYFYFTAGLGLLSIVCFFLFPWLSLIFAALDLLLFLFQFVLYKEIIDPLLPERESVNVTAVRPCSGEVRQRIFLNGHLDAAWEFPLNYYFGGVVFEIPGIMSISGVVYYMIVSICMLCNAGPWVQIVGVCGLIFVPFLILVACTYNPNRIVDGANDNLSGCYMGIALLHSMEQQGIAFEHTEVGVILTGSEEAGLRGAKAWSRMHQDDYRDVPTYILCFDTIHDPKQLMVNQMDLNGTVPSDQELSNAFLHAAKELKVPCRTGKIPLLGGATDNAAFVQGGFRSTSITGLSHKLEKYYHTRKDSYDNINEEGLENCYKATVQFIKKMDQKENGTISGYQRENI